ncbi:MAG TPA: protein translocase subunit SecD [Mycobacteriales bacterium]|jgi:preprotein translocase subunit SecD|nr:protein translocase subunit SecD [Mycobacteriales bacterium]
MATKTPARKQPRPSRPLALLLLVLVGLNVFVLVQGWKPRQGLDLVGGTSVILTPKGGKPSSQALQAAVDIIRQRVNGTGVSSAEVVAEGQNVRVSLPSVGRSEALRIVGTTAELTFRPVVNTLQPGPQSLATPTPTPTAKTPAKPSASAKPTASATASTSKRALSAALLPAQTSPSPTPAPTTPAASATPKATPKATATPTPGIGNPTGADRPLTIQEAIEKIDCSSEADRQRVAESFGAPSKDKEQIVSCDADGGAKYILGPAEMTGRDVKTAQATIPQSQGTVSTGQWVVELEMKSASRWATLTEQYVNKQLAIVLDGITQSAPNINEKITGGRAQISGNFTEKSANGLANVLKYGALPVQFEQSQTQTISPTLGKQSLHGGLIAGLLGLGLVLVYALVYYRGLGLVTVLGLLVFGGLNWALVVILGHTIGFTLTLAGIAGLIVSVGISADSYVVFYERLKDEVREGRSLRASVDRGFTRAFRTILTADFVSFLAAAVLYFLSVGEVRGFAFTLGLATALDVFVAYLFTRPLVTLLTRTRLFSEGRFVGIKSAPPIAAAKEA